MMFTRVFALACLALGADAFFMGTPLRTTARVGSSRAATTMKVPTDHPEIEVREQLKRVGARVQRDKPIASRLTGQSSDGVEDCHGLGAVALHAFCCSVFLVHVFFFCDTYGRSYACSGHITPIFLFLVQEGVFSPIGEGFRPRVHVVWVLLGGKE